MKKCLLPLNKQHMLIIKPIMEMTNENKHSL